MTTTAECGDCGAPLPSKDPEAPLPNITAACNLDHAVSAAAKLIRLFHATTPNAFAQRAEHIATRILTDIQDANGPLGAQIILEQHLLAAMQEAAVITQRATPASPSQDSSAPS